MVKLYKFLISFGIKGNVDNTLVKTYTSAYVWTGRIEYSID